MNLNDLRNKIQGLSDEELDARIYSIRANRKRPPKDPEKAKRYEQKEDKKTANLVKSVTELDVSTMTDEEKMELAKKLGL